MAENMYTNPDGSPSWIGGDRNPSTQDRYNPGTRTASRVQENQWTAAERARLLAIEAQKRGTLQAIERSRTQAQEQYNIGSSALGGQVQTGRRTLAEYLAQRGLTNSGISAQGEINAIGNLQSGLGQLQASRQDALANLEAQRVAAEQNYLQQQAEMAGSAEARQLAEQEQSQARDLSAIQSGAYNQDIQAEINRRKAINPNDPMLPFLQAQRNQKLSGIAEAEAEARQQDFENQLALARLSGSRSSGSGGSGSTSDSYKPLLTEAQARAGMNSENPSYEDYEAYDFYHGTNLLDDFIKANPLDERNYAQAQPIEVLLNQRTDPSGWLSLIRAYYESGGITEEKANALLKQYGLER